jgi:purine-binding chemotaxis protein CheW
MSAEPKPGADEALEPPEAGLLLFGLSTELYALRIEEVLEVMALPRFTPVPRAPAYLLGVCFRRGHLLPILDLGRRLGLRPGFRRGVPPLARAERPTVLVARGRLGEIGLLVDRIVRVARVAESAIHRSEAGPDTRGTVVAASDQATLLDLDAIELEGKA